MADALLLPDDAFLVDSLEVLDAWIHARMSEMPDWIRAAVKSLQPIERAALRNRSAQPEWAYDSAHQRLRLAAIARDGRTPSSLFLDELSLFDNTLRIAAKASTDEDRRMQIGAIRLELRRVLSRRVEARRRVAYAGA